MAKIDDIHRAALKIINREGLTGAPVSRIAREAGVAAGTMYVYYKSKDELLLSLYGNIQEELGAALKEVMDENLAEKPRFFRLWLAAFKYYIKNPDAFMFTKQFSSSPLVKMTGESAIPEGYRLLAKVLEAGQEEKLLKKMPLPVAVAIVSGIIERTVDIQLSGSLQLSGDLLQDLLEGTWRMLETV